MVHVYKVLVYFVNNQLDHTLLIVKLTAMVVLTMGLVRLTLLHHYKWAYAFLTAHHNTNNTFIFLPYYQVVYHPHAQILYPKL